MKTINAKKNHALDTSKDYKHVIPVHTKRIKIIINESINYSHERTTVIQSDFTTSHAENRLNLRRFSDLET